MGPDAHYMKKLKLRKFVSGAQKHLDIIWGALWEKAWRPPLRPTKSESLWVGSKHLYFVKAPGLRTSSWPWFSLARSCCQHLVEQGPEFELHCHLIQKMTQMYKLCRCRHRHTYWIYVCSVTDEEHLKYKMYHALFSLLHWPQNSWGLYSKYVQPDGTGTGQPEGTPDLKLQQQSNLNLLITRFWRSNGFSRESSSGVSLRGFKAAPVY